MSSLHETKAPTQTVPETEPEPAPAQFLCGARRESCRHCGAAVWSVVVRSQPKSAGRFSRLPPTRRQVEDNGETLHASVCSAARGAA